LSVGTEPNTRHLRQQRPRHPASRLDASVHMTAVSEQSRTVTPYGYRMTDEPRSGTDAETPPGEQ